MLNENNRAFKEWAVVVAAMERGEMVLIIRKGGIVEEGGAFEVQDPEFFLFPNYTHQNPAQLKSEAHPLLEESEAERPDELEVRISSYAEVAEVFTIPNEDVLSRLDGQHLWTHEYVAERLHYKPNNPLYALALRVYKLPEPFSLFYLASYGGCTSWITLDGCLPTAGATPALDDAAFSAKLDEIRHLIEGR